MRRVALLTIICFGFLTAGCRFTRDIVDLTPPPSQPPLQELENHLRYVDPDAGKPTYVRAQQG